MVNRRRQDKAGSFWSFFPFVQLPMAFNAFLFLFFFFFFFFFFLRRFWERRKKQGLGKKKAEEKMETEN
jgi:TRAP-type C4-dicarboxylate transport system permease small subunit